VEKLRIDIPMILILCFVVLVSGCVSEGKNTNSTEIYSQNNISFTYPSTWEITNTTSQDAVVALADPTTVHSGNPTTSVVIQKPAVAANSNLTSVYDSNYDSFFNNTNVKRISEGNITINGNNALENIYESNATGVQLEYQAVWVDYNGTIYVILGSALPTDYKNQQTNFYQIMNSFKGQ